MVCHRPHQLYGEEREKSGVPVVETRFKLKDRMNARVERPKSTLLYVITSGATKPRFCQHSTKDGLKLLLSFVEKQPRPIIKARH